MRVLTYVEGKITVINDIGFYSDTAIKPSFITGVNFYYEPTLKMMDDIPLNDEQILNAEAFIDSFTPPIAAVVEPKPILLYHCVDAGGNYVGELNNTDKYLVVDTAPSGENEKWYEGSWAVCCLVDSVTGMYIGYGDTRYNKGTKYAPDTLSEYPFLRSHYFYTTAWNISIIDAKNDMKIWLKTEQDKELRGILGDTASWEIASFTTQEKEARAWLLDNLAATPFIDVLLASRANGETKSQLIDKVITKADAYSVFYAGQIGKFQRLIKQVDACTTVDEVKAIVW